MKRTNPSTGKNLPPCEILEMVAKLRDQDVDGDAQITAWKQQLEQAKTAWHAAIKAFDTIRFKVEGLPGEIAAVQADIASLDEKRPAAIAGALVGDGDFSADDELLKRHAVLALHADRLAVARPALERQQQAANNRVAEACRPVTALEEDIAHRRRELKLAEAERRCAA